MDAVSALLYDNLVIEETRSGAPDPEQAAALLAERALEAGVERFVDREELDELLARIAFASEHASVAKIDIETRFARTLQRPQKLRRIEDRGDFHDPDAGTARRMRSC